MVGTVALAAPRDATREVTVPVVTLESVDGGVVERTLSVTARTIPNRTQRPSVGVMEQSAGAASGPWLTTLWQASFAATQTTRSRLLDHEFLLSVSGPVRDHSAGLMTGATLAALLRGKKVLPHTTVCGGLNPDGSAGPVEGLLPRLRGAAADGVKRFGVPRGGRQQRDDATGDAVDLLAEGTKLGVEVRELSDLDEAYNFLTGDSLPSGAAATDAQMELWPQELAAINKLTASVKQRYEAARAQLAELPEKTRDMFERSTRAADDFEKSGDPVRAMVVWSATLGAVQVAVQDEQLRRTLAAQDFDGGLALLEAEQASLATERQAFRTRIDEAFPNTSRANDVYAMDLLESAVTQGPALRAAATLKALQQRDENFAQRARQLSSDLMTVQAELENGQRFLELYASLPRLKKQVPPIDAANLAPWYVSAGAAARGLFQSRGDEAAFEKDSTWHDLVGYSELLTTEADPRARLVLAARQSIYSSYLASVYDALGGHLDERRAFSVRNTRGLVAQLELARAKVLRSCGQASRETGSIPFPARMRFLNARAAREGSDRQKADALADLWIANWWCDFAVRDQH